MFFYGEEWYKNWHMKDVGNYGVGCDAVTFQIKILIGCGCPDTEVR
jgi:hypothetical protein